MQFLSRCLALLLAALMILPPGNAYGLGHKKKKQPIAADASTLTQDQRVLQALNRLTFGPRPGDVAAVEAMGLDKWIDQQLDPGKIDDSAFDARLSAYPAMQLSLHDLVERFPSPAMIRQAERGKLPIPHDSVEKAIYFDQIAQLREKQAQKAQQARLTATNNQQGSGAPPSSAAAQPAVMVAESAGEKPQGAPMSVQPGMMEPAAPQNEMSVQSGSGMAESMAPPPMRGDAAAMPNSEAKAAVVVDPATVLNLPSDQRVRALVAMRPGEFRDFMRLMSKPQRVTLFADLSPMQRETVFALINPQLVVGGEVLVTRLLRDIYSERQLEAVMTDFWLNHFNVYLKKGEYAAWYLAQYQDQVIRPHAMGKFEDLLVATAESPAMLFYLDQNESVGPHSLAAERNAMSPNGKAHPLGINENYAREVMELHTLGVDGGYTQRDVTQLADVFSGWGIDHPELGGQFFFNDRRHEPGQKVVLGYVIPPNGQKEGLEVLHMLAVSPATAHHVSFQMAQRFVSDTPPPAIVDAMAATWVKTGGDIREVLRTMLASPQFWSQDAYRAKVKTPEEYVVSAVRATGGDAVHPAVLVEAMGQLGMPLYGCQTPNGYSWNADAWLNSGELLDRMNFSLALADNNAGTLMRWDERMDIADEPDTTAEAKETRLENLLLDAGVSAQTRAAVLAQLAQQQGAPAGDQPHPARMKPVNFVRPRDFGQLLQAAAPLPQPADQDAALLAGLLLGSPEFQRR
ncbi:MAG TPA: DUF1800 family protein [Acidobacteriaceae bacterium]|jgi:uncharacterized protein (DUF1800 family)|nr:DUF1800 family protein [Acidobacteriaceae bacterium]